MKTPDEITEEILELVNKADPKPANGFETYEDETEWTDRTNAKFMDLVNRWPKH